MTNSADKVLIEHIVENEIDQSLDEGLLDLVRQFAGKTKNAAAGAFDVARKAMDTAVQTFAANANTRVSSLVQLTRNPDIQNVIGLIQQAEKETGEKVPMDDAMKAATSLAQISPTAAQEAQQATAEANQTAKQQTQPKTPAAQPTAAPQAQPASQTESFETTAQFVSELASLSEESVLSQRTALTEWKGKQQLDEALGVVAIASLVLSGISGMALLGGGIERLGKFLGLKAMEHAGHSIAHVFHVLESKITALIPHRLSYVVYKKLYEKGIKLTKQLMAFEGWKYADDVRAPLETLIYRLSLLNLIVPAVGATIKAGISALGAAKAASIAVKSYEIAKGVQQASALGTTA